MRRPLGIAAALSAVTLATAGLVGAPAALARSTPDIPSHQTLRSLGWQCRTGTVQPSQDLTAVGTVCARYSAGQWLGSGVVTLTATGRTVTGGLSQSAHPNPATEVAQTFTPFTVAPGHPVVLRLGGKGQAEGPHDTAATWVAAITVGKDGSPTELPTKNGQPLTFEGRLSSPVVHRTAAQLRSNTFTGEAGNSCTTRRVAAAGPAKVTGVLSLCVRQSDGYAYAEAPRLTYTSIADTDISISLVIDGNPTTLTIAPLAASKGTKTVVSLPSSSSRLLSRDRSALTAVEIGSTTLRSLSIRLRH